MANKPDSKYRKCCERCTRFQYDAAMEGPGVCTLHKLIKWPLNQCDDFKRKPRETGNV